MPAIFTRIFALIPCILLAALAFSGRAQAQPPDAVVTINSDTFDAQPAIGSLRWAILEAKRSPKPGPYRIDINLPPGNNVIELDGPLPAIDRDVRLFGFGAVLDGSGLNDYIEPEAGFHIVLGAGRTMINGLEIRNCTGPGILLEDARDCMIGDAKEEDFRLFLHGNGAKMEIPAQIVALDADNLKIENTLVGFRRNGDEAEVPAGGTDAWGIYIESSDNVKIESDRDDRRNYISGNALGGVYLYDCRDPELEHNVIGPNFDLENPGVAADQEFGVVFEEVERGIISDENIIAGNDSCGVVIFNSTTIKIHGNDVGVIDEDTGGALPFGNGAFGVLVAGESDDVEIGRDEEGYDNAFADNGEGGVYIADGPTGVVVRNNEFVCSETATPPIVHEAAGMTAAVEVVTQNCTISVSGADLLSGKKVQVYKKGECAIDCSPGYMILEETTNGEGTINFSPGEEDMREAEGFMFVYEDPETGNTMAFDGACEPNYFMEADPEAETEFIFCAETESLELGVDDFITYVIAPESIVWTRGQDVIAEGEANITITEPGEYMLAVRHGEPGAPKCETGVAFVVERAPLSVSAGPDETILAGDGLVLNGAVDGVNDPDNLELNWTPAGSLDVPASLAPVATPEETTTYTLTASYESCEATDETTVFVQEDAGGVEWFDASGGTNADLSGPVAGDGEGHLYAAGVFRGTGDFGGRRLNAGPGEGLYLMKYTLAGEVLWARAWPATDSVSAASLAYDRGALYLAGDFVGALALDESELTSAGGRDGFLAKFDAEGAVEWARGYGGPARDVLSGAAPGNNGQVFVVGAHGAGATLPAGGVPLTNNGGSDILTAAFDADGGLLWHNEFGGATNDGAASAYFSEDGNLYAGGWFNGSVEVAPGLELVSEGLTDGFLVKIDTTGGIRWGRGLGGLSVDRVVSVTGGPAGVVVGGEFNDALPLGEILLESVGARDAFVAGVDTSGGVRWGRGIGGMSVDRLAAVASNAEGVLYVAGEFEGALSAGPSHLTARGGDDYYLARLSSATGRVVWAVAGGGTRDDHCVGLVALPGNDGAVCSGDFRETATFDERQWTAQGETDAFVFRFCPACGTSTERPETAAAPGSGLLVYPNPAGRDLRLSAPQAAPGESLTATIVSPTGQIAAKLNAAVGADGAAALRLPKLPAGVYVLRAAGKGWEGAARFVAE